MTVYGYARVSSRDQDLIAQDAELMAAGCAKVFKEKISGFRCQREGARSSISVCLAQRPPAASMQPIAISSSASDPVRDPVDALTVGIVRGVYECLIGFDHAQELLSVVRGYCQF